MSQNLDENVIKSLEKLKDKIIKGDYTEFQKEDIYETIEAYNNQMWNIDANLVKYLFTGWAVHSQRETSLPREPFSQRGASLPREPLPNDILKTNLTRDDNSVTYGSRHINIPRNTRYRDGKFYVGSMPKEFP